MMQLGHGVAAPLVSTPAVVKSMLEHVIVKGECGDYVTILLSKAGEVFYAGFIGGVVVAAFTKVQQLVGLKIVQVKAGATWMAALSGRKYDQNGY
jgi:hypothetical protein